MNEPILEQIEEALVETRKGIDKDLEQVEIDYPAPTGETLGTIMTE